MRKSRFTEEQIVGILPEYGRDFTVEPGLSGPARAPRAAERAPDHFGRQVSRVWLSHVACQAGPRGLQGERQGIERIHREERL